MIPSSNKLATDRLKILARQARVALYCGDYSLATALYSDILVFKSDYAAALHGLGCIAFLQADYVKATILLKQAVNAKISKKDRLNALFYLAVALHFISQNVEAISYLIELLALDPGHVAARNNLGLIYLENHQLALAAHNFKKLTLIAPRYADAHANLGYVLFKQGKVRGAIACAKNAIDIDPNHAVALRNLGIGYQTLGRFDEARNCFESAILRDPMDGGAYGNLVETKKITPQDSALVTRLKELTLSTGLTPQGKSDALFALGKCLDDLAEYDAAFASYSEANRLERGSREFNRQQHEEFVDAQIQTFSSAFFQRHGAMFAPDSTPIFIVGMPRSGTTLIEQILSRHPEVSSAGECLYWGNLGGSTDVVQNISDKLIPEYAHSYLTHLRAIAPVSKHVIDKMPTNFLFLGLIHLCFPAARIIHCQRHPLDTCLSNYFHKFSNSSSYSYDLHDLAFFYRQYERIMTHWRRVLADNMLEICYESVVASQEAETRKILTFCNLEWNEDCLDFSHNQRPVFTASNWQVRQPLFSSSINRWQHYRAHLGPLLQLAP